MKPGVFQGKKFPFTPKRRKRSLGSQCNNIIDTRHDLAAFRSKLANVSWLRNYREPPHCRQAPRFWDPPHIVWQLWGANHHKHNPHKLHDLPILKRVAERVLETAKKTVVGVSDGAAPSLTWPKFRAMTTHRCIPWVAGVVQPIHWRLAKAGAQSGAQEYACPVMLRHLVESAKSADDRAVVAMVLVSYVCFLQVWGVPQ